MTVSRCTPASGSHPCCGKPKARRSTAEPDEEFPATAAYAEGTRDHWRYLGERAAQSWRAPDPGPDLEVLVNGRFCYWASQSPIPGGTSFENFELSEPFADGREYAFAVKPMG